MDHETAFWVGPAHAPDSYRLVRLLGGGGEGEVWEAVLPLSDQGWRRVAVKILPGSRNPEEEAQWLHHGHLLRSLADPGLVRVTDHFLGEVKHRGGTIAPVRDGDERTPTADPEQGNTTTAARPVIGDDLTMPHGSIGYRYVVMDLVEGPTLREWVDENPQATARERLRLLSMVAVALDAMHSGAQTAVPVAHGDVKPSNIVVQASGGAVLVDMGLTRLADGPGGYGSSLPYAAPELRQDGRSSVAADRFAFYATVAHVLTGEVPFVAGNGLVDLRVLEQRLLHAPSTQGRPALAHGLLSAMAAPPMHRPQPLRQWLSALSDTLTGTTTGPRTTLVDAPAPLPTEAPRRGRSKLPLVIAAIVVLLLVAGGVLFALTRGSSNDHAVVEPTPGPNSSQPTPTDSPTDSPGPTDSPTASPTQIGALPPGAIYLDDTEGVKVQESESGSSNFQEYGISGKKYGHAVGLDAGCDNSDGGDVWVDFNLGRQFKTLTTTVGIDDTSPADAQTSYKIIGDGKVLQQGTLRLGSSIPVNLPVDNVLRVRLFANDPSTGNCSSSTTTTVFGDPTASP